MVSVFGPSGTSRLCWRAPQWPHRRDLPDDLYDHVGANAAINQNIAIYDRFIINTSDDAYVFGLDAETGELAWETPIFDYTEISALHSSVTELEIRVGPSDLPR